YSVKVWQHMRSKGRFPSHLLSLKRVMEWLATKKSRNNIWIILNKLILSVTVYFLWIERNKRIFKDEARKSDELITIIKGHMVAMLLSLTVKSSEAVVKLKPAKIASELEFSVMDSAFSFGLRIRNDYVVFHFRGIELEEEHMMVRNSEAVKDEGILGLRRIMSLKEDSKDVAASSFLGELGELFGEKTVVWSVFP
ncbi:hypothetical protein Tco_1084965, partial [Tanacetum coccineum]